MFSKEDDKNLRISQIHHKRKEIIEEDNHLRIQEKEEEDKNLRISQIHHKRKGEKEEDKNLRISQIHHKRKGEKEEDNNLRIQEKEEDKNLRISQIHHKRKEESNNKILNRNCGNNLFRKILAIGTIATIILLLASLTYAETDISSELGDKIVVNPNTGIEQVQEINTSFNTEAGIATIQEIGTWTYGGLIKIPPKKVYNNINGASDTEKASGSLRQYIYYKSDGHFGWEWNRSNPLPKNGYILPIYPEVILDSTSGYFPIKLRDISSLSVELGYSYPKTPQGAYNLAYDIFFNDGVTKAEVMIWLNSRANVGIYGGVVSDGYNSYDFYYTNPTTSRPWAYYAFILKTQSLTQINHQVNIKTLFNFLQSSGRLNPEWNMPFLDLGNEIWRSSGRIEINKWAIYLNGRYITPSTSPNIYITSPNGGENLIKGTARTVSWTYNSSSGSYVKIDLLKSGVLNRVINVGTLNDGSYSWSIPSDQTTGADYKIKITSTSNPAYLDTSNNNFAISSPTYISTASPNGGETLVRGTTKTVRWNYAGSPGTYVKIELLKSGVLNRVISYSTPIGSSGSGYYNWYVPTTQTLGSDYKIKITSTTNPVYTDTSNNNFIISTPYIRVTSPNGWENWVHGATKTITWSIGGSTGSYIKIELLKSGVLNRVISSSTPNDGSFSWVIPSTQTLGSDYKIRITSTSNSVYADTSNNNFIIS